MKRNRLVYLLVCVLLVIAGLASRHFAHALPKFITLYAGDTLWATMIFFAFGFVFAHWPLNRLFVVVLLFCWAVEASQLYHAPWIDHLRSYKLGGLLLGYDFLWSDIACYTVGVCLGWLAERLFLYDW